MKYFLKITFLLIFLFIFHFSLPSNSQDINKIIDDFTDNPERRWQFYTDQVMGGVSEGSASVRLDSEGPYVRLEGLVSTANNGGFIQFRTKVKNHPKVLNHIFLCPQCNASQDLKRFCVNYLLNLHQFATRM